MSKSPSGGINSTSTRIGRVSWRLDRFGGAQGSKSPKNGQCSTPPRIGHVTVRLDRFDETRDRRSPTMAHFSKVSIVTRIRGQRSPRSQTKMYVAPNRPFLKVAPIDLAKRGSKMPSTGLRSTSPQIGHFRLSFDRFGDTRDRRAPTTAHFRKVLIAVRIQGWESPDNGL